MDAAAQKKSERRRTLMEGQQYIREGFQSKQQNKPNPKSSNHNLQGDDDDDDDDDDNDDDNVPIASQLANIKLQSEHEASTMNCHKGAMYLPSNPTNQSRSIWLDYLPV